MIGYSKKHLQTLQICWQGPTPSTAPVSPHSFSKSSGFNLAASSVGQDRQFPAVEDKKSLRKGDLVSSRGEPATESWATWESSPKSAATVLSFHPRSTSYGVIVSSSAEPYYASRYLRGGRVLKENEPLVVAEKRKAALTNHNKRSIPLTAGNNVNAGNSETIFNNPVNKSDTLLLTEHDPLKTCRQVKTGIATTRVTPKE